MIDWNFLFKILFYGSIILAVLSVIVILFAKVLDYFIFNRYYVLKTGSKDIYYKILNTAAYGLDDNGGLKFMVVYQCSATGGIYCMNMDNFNENFISVPKKVKLKKEE